MSSETVGIKADLCHPSCLVWCTTLEASKQKSNALPDTEEHKQERKQEVIGENQRIAGNTVVVSYRDTTGASGAAPGRSSEAVAGNLCIKATSGWTGEMQGLHKGNSMGHRFKLMLSLQEAGRFNPQKLLVS